MNWWSLKQVLHMLGLLNPWMKCPSIKVFCSSIKLINLYSPNIIDSEALLHFTLQHKIHFSLKKRFIWWGFVILYTSTSTINYWTTIKLIKKIKSWIKKLIKKSPLNYWTTPYSQVVIQEKIVVSSHALMHMRWEKRKYMWVKNFV
jgi:hypothetical protein